MKIVGIIQARMGSTRLPGKVLRPILGTPMLGHIIQRLSQSTTIDELVVATSTLEQDRDIVEYAKKIGCAWSQGSEEDVLGRYYQAAMEFNADVVLRLTGDCPLIDPETTDRVVSAHLKAEKSDMASNVLVRSFPRGLDTEALSMACLERINYEATEPIYREHVTNYIHDYQEKFKLTNVLNDADESSHRWCVDTEDDFKLISVIYESLYAKKKHFGFKDVLELMQSRPDLPLLNKHVAQAKIFKRKTIP